MITHNEIIYNLTEKILSDCKENSIDIRLFGSVALLFLDRAKHGLNGKYRRAVADIDMIVKPNHIRELENYFLSRGYETDREIKMLFGNKRRCFYSGNNISIDVFIGNITLCQDIFVLDRFDLSYPTLTPSDLFLTKIQKINLSDKDVVDMDFILGFDIDFQYIIGLSSKNWNWWKTLTTNIPFLLKADIGEGSKNLLGGLLFKIESNRKTMSWKVRNVIGGRMGWYNDVE